MEIGLSTLEEECASQGLDWEEVLEQRSREKNKMKELGLTEADLTKVMSVAPTTEENNKNENTF
jgi:capsid protein